MASKADQPQDERVEAPALDRTKDYRSGKAAGGTIAGRAPSAAVRGGASGAAADGAAEATGSPGAEADREEAQEVGGRP